MMSTCPYHLIRAAQHSVHPTGGSRRVFRQFLCLTAGSGKMALSRPAHPRVTLTVGRFGLCTQSQEEVLSEIAGYSSK